MDLGRLGKSQNPIQIPRILMLAEPPLHEDHEGCPLGAL
jgi:hypothetical protein